MNKNNKKKTKSPLPLIAYAKRTFERYQALSKKEKSTFLNCVEKDFGGHCKSIIRLYRSFARPTLHKDVKGATLSIVKPQGKRGPKPKFDDPDAIGWLQILWINMNRPSEKLMHPMLPLWLNKNTDPALTQEIKFLILSMSPASIERYLRSYKKAHEPKPFCTTKQPRKNIF